jgi:RNA polymerase sigma factor (sigma-70 family)
MQQIMNLFEQRYEELYCYLRRFTNPTETEDLCQQVFLKLADEPNITALGSDGIFRIARTLLQSRYRPLLRIQKALRAIQGGSRWNTAQLQNTNEHPQPMTTRRLRKLERAIKLLPADQRQSIRLVIAEGLTTEEASCKMGVTSSLVEAWASSGLERLNEQRIFNHVEHAH